MPWHVESDNPDCDGWAVVQSDSDEVVGCHDTEREALDHLAALNANVEHDTASYLTPRRRSTMRLHPAYRHPGHSPQSVHAGTTEAAEGIEDQAFERMGFYRDVEPPVEQGDTLDDTRSTVRNYLDRMPPDDSPRSHEEAALVAPDGRIRRFRVGSRRSVNLEGLGSGVGDEFLHNHPGSASLSRNDLAAAVDRGWSAVEAQGSDGTRFRMEFDDEQGRTPTANIVGAEDRRVFAAVQSAIENDPSVTQDVADALGQAHSHVVAKRLAEMFEGLTYTYGGEPGATERMERIIEQAEESGELTDPLKRAAPDPLPPDGHVQHTMCGEPTYRLPGALRRRQSDGERRRLRGVAVLRSRGLNRSRQLVGVIRVDADGARVVAGDVGWALDRDGQPTTDPEAIARLMIQVRTAGNSAANVDPQTLTSTLHLRNN